MDYRMLLSIEIEMDYRMLLSMLVQLSSYLLHLIQLIF